MRKNRVKLFFASTMALMLAFESPVAFAIPVQAQAEETSSDFNYPSGERYSVLTAGDYKTTIYESDFYKNYDSTDLSTAVSSDPSVATVTEDIFTLNKTELSLTAGGKDGELYGSDYEKITAVSSDTSVATVDNKPSDTYDDDYYDDEDNTLYVHPLSSGTTTITATNEYGTTATCTVTVSLPAFSMKKKSVEFKNPNTKKSM